MVIVITQLHTTFMVLLAIVPFFMIPVFADVEVEGVSGFYGHDDAYNVIGVVKNSGNYSALAAVTIQLEYGNTVVETTVYTHNIKANGEIPFKIPLYDTDGEIPKIFNVRATHINGISHSPQIESYLHMRRSLSSRRNIDRSYLCKSEDHTCNTGHFLPPQYQDTL